MLSRLIESFQGWLPLRSPMLNRFLGLLGVDTMVRASGVVFLPLYLRLMSQEAYASFSYVTSLVGVLALVCNFGLYIAQSKLLHEFTGRQRNDAIFTINLLLALMLCGVLLPLYAFGWDRLVIRLLFSGAIKYEKYRYLIPVGVVLAVYAQMLLNFFLTNEQIRSVQRYNTSRIVLGLLLTLGALYLLTGDGATVRMLAYFAAEIIALGMFFWGYARSMRGRFNARIASRSLALGLPIMGSAVLGCVTNFSDKFFVERYCTPAQMSVYFFGLALSGAVSLVSMSFQNVWLPAFLKETDLTVNLNRTRRAGRHLLLLLALLSVAIWIAAAMCVSFGIFKHEYAPVLTILPILLASGVATGITGLLSAYTIYWNMTYMTVVVGAFVAALSAFLNYFAVSSLGIYGAAWTSLLVNALFAVTYLWFVRHRSALQLATVSCGAKI